jgi:hypothetical protein
MNADELTAVQCVGADGVARNFYYRLNRDPFANFDGVRSAWTFSVFDRPVPEPGDDCFDAEFVQVDPERVLSRTMAHKGMEQYRAKGIPEALILEAARQSGCRCVSSSSRGFLIDETESRTDAATKVWRRLITAGFAAYDETEDRYGTL